MDQKSEVAAIVKQSTSTVSGSVENERICQLSNGPINGRLRCSNQTAGAVQSAASVRLITVNRDRRTIGQWKTGKLMSASFEHGQ
ncbi:Magnetosome formation protease MamE [Trichinella spiralis]|uniref:Magnetosome formation protease MamE n=1 Tax=Trichinella spiralis TaxID=6334 RepID=A0ABR3KE30_TRISP